MFRSIQVQKSFFLPGKITNILLSINPMNKLLLILSLTGALLVAGGLFKAFHESNVELYSAETKSSFKLWKSTNAKNYNSESEESYRLGVFHSNSELVKTHNASGATWTMALNGFADMTTEEFSAQYKGWSKSAAAPRNEAAFTATATESVDWTTKGAVTGVKNQGQCGSCWAFSATGGMEAGYFLKTGKLVSLSEQQLVACSKTSGGNMGCKGGLPELAFAYAKDKGMELESSYKYAGQWYFSCKYSADKTIADFKLTGYTTVPKADSDALKAAVAASPVSIGINAAVAGFQMYHSGVMSYSSCPAQLDHGVMIVGYGTDNGKDFWKVKNSWGGSWGESGYFRIARVSGKGIGMCGVTEDATVPNF